MALNQTIARTTIIVIIIAVITALSSRHVDTISTDSTALLGCSVVVITHRGVAGRAFIRIRI